MCWFLIISGSPRKQHPPNRANESPLTFLRFKNENNSFIKNPNIFKALKQSALLRFFDQSIACISSSHGDRIRQSIYMAEEEYPDQLDTMALRKTQSFFTWKDGIAAAVTTDENKSHQTVSLRIADSKSATACIEHCIERLFESSPFLSDPNNVFIVPTSRIHIVMSFSDRRGMKKICGSSSPVELSFVKLMWRRTGVICVQWKVTRGNVDRLRCDLNGWMDFVIESVIGYSLHKPSPTDYLLAISMISELNHQFTGLTAEFYHLHKINEVFPLLEQFPDTTTDIGKLLWSAHLLTHSPSISRMVLSSLGITALAIWAIHLAKHHLILVK